MYFVKILYWQYHFTQYSPAAKNDGCKYESLLIFMSSNTKITSYADYGQ